MEVFILPGRCPACTPPPGFPSPLCLFILLSPKCFLQITRKPDFGGEGAGRTAWLQGQTSDHGVQGGRQTREVQDTVTPHFLPGDHGPLATGARAEPAPILKYLQFFSSNC